MFKELLYMLTFALNNQTTDISGPILHQPEKLVNLAAQKVPESKINSIPSYLLPVLGFIRFSTISEEKDKCLFEEYQEDKSNIFRVNNLDYLDIRKTEYFSKIIFKDIIKNKHEKGEACVFAILTVKNKDGVFNECYDAFHLNRFLFGKKYLHKKIEFLNKNIKDPRTKQLIFGNIKYFVLFADTSEAKYLGDHKDLLIDSKKSDLMKKFFAVLMGEGVLQDWLKLVEIAADEGLAQAEEYLGLLYMQSDVKKAQGYLERAAAKGSVKALNNLGYISSQNGKKELAKDFYYKACQKGDPKAEYNLAELYKDEGNLDLAKAHYKLSAEKGCLYAQFKLANILKKEAKEQESKHYFNLAGQQQDTQKLFDLAISCFEEGKFKLSKIYLNIMLNQDCKDLSQVHLLLGQIYQHQDNIKKAKVHFKIAADLTSISAQFLLGCLYYGEKNIEQAIYYLGHAADRGHIEAQYNLGLIYFSIGNQELAERYLKKAADAGDKDAQVRLGVFYFRAGKKELAESYLKSRADNGDANAQYTLGLQYAENGDQERAKYYLILAAEQGDVAAINYLLNNFSL